MDLFIAQGRPHRFRALMRATRLGNASGIDKQAIPLLNMSAAAPSRVRRARVGSAQHRARPRDREHRNGEARAMPPPLFRVGGVGSAARRVSSWTTRLYKAYRSCAHTPLQGVRSALPAIGLEDSPGSQLTFDVSVSKICAGAVAAGRSLRGVRTQEAAASSGRTRSRGH